MFKKLLIANRGEIACRIIKTAKKMNIRTVAVYSEIDAQALHVQMADESVCIGPASSSLSYLNIDNIIEAAQKTQAQAIHPGYGFLSEDAEFAERLQQAGLIFIGPSADAIRTMGDKNLAKETMQNAGVPVVPGFHGDCTDLKALTQAAIKVGFPVLIKASAGGGGKGMRLVEKPEQLAEAVQGAMREAQASFGDSKVFLEKYLSRARHIEIQILFDQYGKGIYLFDRDCSVQRRHQKVVEEAPAPGISEKTRLQMAKTALQAGTAIHYRSTGTIEFLLDEQENFYFMEMNTRLQVEHPVTEMITGLDLVEWQLRIAAAEVLNLQQEKIIQQGHSVEVRLYAENPENNFMPSAGVLQHFILPEQTNRYVRCDSGFQTGNTVSIYYDPLLAKLIAWGENRLEAIHNLQKMLDQTAVVGIHTNWSLLYRIVHHDQFLNGKITTQFIPENQSNLLIKPKELSNEAILIACLALRKYQQEELLHLQQQNEDSLSPWFISDHWRLNHSAATVLYLWQDSKKWQISVIQTVTGLELFWENQRFHPAAEWLNDYHVNIQLSDKTISAITFYEEREIIVFFQGQQWIFTLYNPISASENSLKEKNITAPMPGTIVEVYVKPGQMVNIGDKLLIMEAMKMEHVLLAPYSGKIQSVFYQAGDKVNEGALLIEFEKSL